ncbi:type III secretion system outer membrane ring subunit SctC [Schlegelella sp. S2-27]|uniref:Type 3 secretion system secretin n=1 Tax=Caldimonas mangrovi TaxID=2944811 RepID=A0ABT0YHR1_9BURK|nr:type III secretion system outer membrane ring subunit SctC [Caldimonas mangrovi]MCM5678255.1 type III secretion system outer membrane ring subunit SctC [Caldimonas mangrovi]
MTTLLVLLAGAAQAMPIPFPDRRVTLTAREQPIQAFLQDLFGQMDLPVNVSPSVRGQVNGSFDGSAERVLRDIGRAFGLLTYYDGTVVHVYAASDVHTRTLPLSGQAGRQVVRLAHDMGLPDARNTVRAARDGSVLVTGTRRFVEQLEELARASRGSAAAPAPLSFKVFYLRYAWAQDVTLQFGGRQVVVPGVASILRSLVTTSGTQPAYLAQAGPQQPTLPGLRGQGLNRTQSPGRLGLQDEGRALAGVDPLVAAYAGGAAAAQHALAVQSAAPSMLPFGDAQQVRVQVDPRLNAIIVRDAPERMPAYQQLIDALDVEPQSLEIEATIIDIDTDRMRELGVDWRWSNAGNSILFGRGDATDLRLRPDADITPQGRGGFVTAVLGSGDQFVARISALQTEGAARVVSSPQVVTLSNVEAIFENNSTFYVRVAGREEVDLFNISAGTTLRVTPHVFKDGEQVRIKLLVTVEDGALTNDAVDQIPVVERSGINTQALIREGESLLIGGMVRDSSGNQVDKVPLLGDLPLVGNLFKRRSESWARVERMFLISPRLARSRPPPQVPSFSSLDAATPPLIVAPPSTPAERASVETVQP